MAKYIAEINVMPHKNLLDPQGNAVNHGLKNLGMSTCANVRVGKHISVEVEADSADKAKEIASAACDKLLANPIMEYFELTVHPA